MYKNNFIKIQNEASKIPISVNNGRFTEYQAIKKNIAPNMQFYNMPYNGTMINNNRQNYNMRKNFFLNKNFQYYFAVQMNLLR